MSHPNSDEQQLSDYLDAVLSEAETAALQERLESDESLADLLAKMQADRTNLRAMFARSSQSAKLGPNFASEVIRAAKQRAHDAEMLTELTADHDTVPVQLAAPKAKSRTTLAWLGAITTAAAVLISVSAYRGGEENPIALASQDSVEELMAANPSTSVDAATDPQDNATPSIQIASSDAVGVESMSPRSLPSGDERTMTPSLSQLADSSQKNAVLPDPAVSATDRMRDEIHRVEAGSLPGDPAATQLGAMMVYDVQLTAQGRQSSIISSWMRRHGLAETSRQSITPGLVGVAKDSLASAESEDFQILFLKAPAKAIDRMFLSLVDDKENVASVSLSFAGEAPILRLAQYLEDKIPATEIRADQMASFEIESEAKELQRIASLLGDRVFLPVKPATGTVSANDAKQPIDANMAASDLNSGRDFLSQVLLLVR